WYLYTSAGSANSAWKPTLSSVTLIGGSNFQVDGTQFYGLTEGAYYGDDSQASSNYPIIRLVDQSGATYYAKSYNFSTMGVATGSTPVSAGFTVAGIPQGNYSLYAVANGIASDPYPFSIGSGTPPAITTQ